MLLNIQTHSFLLFVIICGNVAQEKKGIGTGNNGNLRVCVVEGKGLYKKAGRYCPVLEKSESGVECVIGVDRLDCLRRISKGSVDFGVFTSEDLLAARWADIDVLVTNELRFHDALFEYEVVALIDNKSGIKSLGDLEGSRLCHPGYGYEADWTNTLANYFESTIIQRSCDPKLSLFENRLQASSTFFSAACKAGPWVADRIRDKSLKLLYPDLCSLCYDSRSCSSGDKYWGRRGPLHCLTEEAGNVAWARLDDTRLHFGLSGGEATADPAGFSFLCSDGSIQPITKKRPCVWIAKPWPVVAAKRKSSEAVFSVVSGLSHQNTSSWRSALLSLVELYHVRVAPVQPQVPVQDYLQRAEGFQQANSFAECSPPRAIKMCTNSVVSRHKCDWLAEAARAHGLEPLLDCYAQKPTDCGEHCQISADEACLEDVRGGTAEVVIVPSDLQVVAKRKYKLQTILYEMTPIMNDLYIIVAIVKANSSIKTFKEMRGKRASFPRYDGVAYHSIANFLGMHKLLESNECNVDSELGNFFSGICAPGYSGHNDKIMASCGDYEESNGDIEALRNLVEGKSDVAFIGLSTFDNFTEIASIERWSKDLKLDDFRKVCPSQNSQYCYVTWSSLGQVMISSDATQLRTKELTNAFKQLDITFGKNYKSQTSPFMMFGPFNNLHNVIFHDKTKYFKSVAEMADVKIPHSFDTMIDDLQFENCDFFNSGHKTKSWMFPQVLLVSLLCTFIF